MSAWLYTLLLRSGNPYFGATTDLEKRYKDHCSGKACRTTKLDPPQGLVYYEEFNTFSEARQREAQVERWSRVKKEAVLCGDFAKLQELPRSGKNE